MSVSKPLKWHEEIFLGVLSLSISAFITMRGFSWLIGGRTYSELSSSKTSGIAYAMAQLDQTNWRFILVGIFALIGIIQIQEGVKKYRSKRNKNFRIIYEGSYPYMPFSEKARALPKTSHGTKRIYNQRGLLVSEEYLINDNFFKSKTYKYSEGRIVEETRFHKLNNRREKELTVDYHYDDSGKVDKKVFYDFYRYKNNGYAGYEKFYYDNGAMVRKEIFTHKNNLSAAFIIEEIDRNTHIKRRYEGKNASKLRQINKEVYDDHGNLVLLALNHKPQSETDFTFSSTKTYQYDSDNLVIKEDNLSFEYVKDAEGFWIYQKTIKDGQNVRCNIRFIEDADNICYE